MISNYYTLEAVRSMHFVCGGAVMVQQFFFFEVQQKIMFVTLDISNLYIGVILCILKLGDFLALNVHYIEVFFM